MLRFISDDEIDLGESERAERKARPENGEQRRRDDAVRAHREARARAEEQGEDEGEGERTQYFVVNNANFQLLILTF